MVSLCCLRNCSKLEVLVLRSRLLEAVDSASDPPESPSSLPPEKSYEHYEQELKSLTFRFLSFFGTLSVKSVLILWVHVIIEQ